MKAYFPQGLQLYALSAYSAESFEECHLPALHV